MLWPWPLTYDLEKLIRSGHYHYQCVYQIWEQSIQWFLSYRVNTIAGGGRRAAGGGRLRRKTITSPDPSDTGDIIIIGVIIQISFGYEIKYIIKKDVKNQGAKYRSLRNAFKQFSPFTPWASQFYPLFAIT